MSKLDDVALAAAIALLINNNTTGEITAEDVRNSYQHVIDSKLSLTDGGIVEGNLIVDTAYVELSSNQDFRWKNALGNYVSGSEGSRITHWSDGNLYVDAWEGDIVLRVSGSSVIDVRGGLEADAINASTTLVVAGDATFNSIIDGKRLVSTNNQQNGGFNRGLRLWSATDANWSMYVATAVTGGSTDSDNTQNIGGISGHSIRTRISSASDAGFIWERQVSVGSPVEPIMGLLANGNLTIIGSFAGVGATLSGALNAASASIIGTVATANLSVSNEVDSVLNWGTGFLGSVASDPNILRLYDSGVNVYGFGITGGQLNYCVPSTNTHSWWAGTTQLFDVAATQYTVRVPQVNSAVLTVNEAIRSYTPLLAGTAHWAIRADTSGLNSSGIYFTSTDDAVLYLRNNDGSLVTTFSALNLTHQGTMTLNGDVTVNANTIIDHYRLPLSREVLSGYQPQDTDLRDRIMFDENVAAFRPIYDVEYWNGLAWTAWPEGESIIKELLVGSQVSQSIPADRQHFRFSIQTSAYIGGFDIALKRTWMADMREIVMSIEAASDQAFTTVDRTETLTLPDNNTWYQVRETLSWHVPTTWYRFTIDGTDHGVNAYTLTALWISSMYARGTGIKSFRGLPMSWNNNITYLSNSLDIATGLVYVGVDDSVRGSLLAYGAGTGSSEGGQLLLYTAADHDTTTARYLVQAAGEDFRIATDAETLLQWDVSAGAWATSKPVVITAPVTINGLLTAAGNIDAGGYGAFASWIRSSADTALGALQLGSGDSNIGGSGIAQIRLGFNGNSAQYPHWVASRHNANVSDRNGIDFFTSDGTLNGVFPTNAVFGMAIDGGKVQIGGTRPSVALVETLRVEGTARVTSTLNVDGWLRSNSHVRIANNFDILFANVAGTDEEVISKDTSDNVTLNWRGTTGATFLGHGNGTTNIRGSQTYIKSGDNLSTYAQFSSSQAIFYQNLVAVLGINMTGGEFNFNTGGHGYMDNEANEMDLFLRTTYNGDGSKRIHLILDGSDGTTYLRGGNINRVTLSPTGISLSGTTSLNNRLTIDNAGYQQHLRLTRAGTESWDITPSTDGSLNIVNNLINGDNRVEIGAGLYVSDATTLNSTLVMGGQIQAQHGTVSTPGISFTGYLNAGLFMSSVDMPGMAVLGQIRQRWASFGTNIYGYVTATAGLYPATASSGGYAGVILAETNDFVIRPNDGAGGYHLDKQFRFSVTNSRWEFETDLKTAGATSLGQFTHTANSQGDVILFGNATNSGAQAGNFTSRLRLFGGGSQTRSLDLYQQSSGDAYVTSTFADLHLSSLDTTSNGRILFSTGNQASALTLDIDGNLAGTGLNYLSELVAGHNPEAGFLAGPQFANDVAYARLRQVATWAPVTTNITIPNTSWDTMLRPDASFFNINAAIFAGPTEIVMEFDVPEALLYSTWAGISFGGPGWAAQRVLIEAYSNGAWVTVRDVSDNTSEYVAGSVTGNTAPGTTKLRYTLGNPVGSAVRITHLWGWDYNSPMLRGLYVTRDGGDIYDNLIFANARGVIVRNVDGTAQTVLWKDSSNNTAFNWSGTVGLTLLGHANADTYIRGANVRIRNSANTATIIDITDTAVTFNQGISCGSVVAGTAIDLSNHLSLWGTTYGLNVTSSNVNLVAGAINTFSSTNANIYSRVTHNFENNAHFQADLYVYNNEAIHWRNSADSAWESVFAKQSNDNVVINWNGVTGDTYMGHASGVTYVRGSNTQIRSANNGFAIAQFTDTAINFNQQVNIAAGGLDLADHEVTRAKLKDTSEEVYVHGSVSGAVTADVTNGNVQTMTITGATTLTFSNPIASGDTTFLTLMITNGSTNVTFPAAVTWGDAGAPTLKTAGLNILTFMTIDGGTTWYAMSGYAG